MGLKESGLRGSLRNVSVGIDAIPDSGDYQWYVDEAEGTTINPEIGDVTWSIEGGSWESESGAVGDYYVSLDSADEVVMDSDVTLSNQLTIFGWMRGQFDFSDEFNETILQNLDFADDGWAMASEGDGVPELGFSNQESGSSSATVRNVGWVDNGEWGFFGLLMDGSETRLITWSNSEEVDDSGWDDDGTNPNEIDDRWKYGGDRWGGAELDLDFNGYANFVLSKSELEELWEATQR